MAGTVSPLLVIEHLRVDFGAGQGAVRAVDDVSFAIEPGASYGLVGESGCGKSTLLRAICGLHPHWQGGIRLAGEPLGARRSPAMRRRVQLVFQDPYGSLHPRHTVDTILREPIAVHGLGDANGRIQRVLDQVGLGRAFPVSYTHLTLPTKRIV